MIKKNLLENQLVRMVLAGPFAVTFVSQGCYILIFVDDFSRFTWVYFLCHKSKVVHKLQAFKTHVEHKSRKAIKVYGWTMRIDMWIENFETFVDLRGLIFRIHQHSVCTRQML